MEAYQEFMKVKHFVKQFLDSDSWKKMIRHQLPNLRKRYKEIGIEDDDKIVAQESRRSYSTHREVELYIQTAKIYEILDKHKHLLMKTNNPKKDEDELWNHVRLPFPEIFIDVSFNTEELGTTDEKISGILIKELKHIETMKDEDGDLKPFTIYGLMAYVCGVSAEGTPFFDRFRFPIKSSFGEENANPNLYTRYDDKKLAKFLNDKKLAKFLRKFIINFILFMKEREVTYIESKRSLKNQERRIKQGKIPLPNSRIIKLTGSLKRYVNSLTDNDFKGKLSYRFSVSGHDRHYKHHRYKKMRGKVQWIESFKKGKGVQIDGVRRIIPDEDPDEFNYDDIEPLKKPLRETR